MAITTNSLNLDTSHPLSSPRGGLGASITATQGDILYATSSNTFAVLAKSTSASRYLSNTGTSNNPAWAQIDLTNGVTGTLPVANGGTGIATATAYAVICAGTTATGAFQSLSSLGTAGHVLTSNGAGALPTWQAVGGSGVSSISGTANQIIASSPTGAVTLSTPQDINTTSTVTFGQLTVGSGNIYVKGNNRYLYLGFSDSSRFYYDGTNTIFEANAAGSGSLYISRNTAGTTSAVLYVEQAGNGDVPITWSVSGGQKYTAGIDTSASNDFVLAVGAALGTSNVFSVSSIGAFSFASPLVVSSGGTGLSSTTAYGLITGGTSSTGNFQNAGTGTSGQVYVSGGASALGTWTTLTGIAVTTLTGTANQVLVNGTSGSATSGAITLTLPQSIATSSSVTFGQVTVDSLQLDGNTLSATSGNLILSGSIVTTASPVQVTNNVTLINAVSSANTYGIVTQKSHGASSNTLDGDELGYLSYYGYAGGFQEAARLSIAQQGAVSGANVPTQFNLKLSDATSGLRTVLTVSTDGELTINPGNIFIESDNKGLYLGAGSDSRIYYDGTNTIWNLQVVGTGNLSAQVNDTRTSGIIDLYQGSTGDAALSFSLAATQTYTMGIDNSASDAFVFSVGNAIGTGNVFSISTAGAFSFASPLSVASGGTGIATATAYAVICAGTTSTGAFQALASLGTSGQVLTSNGAGALPTWQSLGGSGVTSITGTANQVLANGTSGSAQTGAVTLTLPQDIATSSAVTFGQVNVDNLRMDGNTFSAQSGDLNLSGSAIRTSDNVVISSNAYVNNEASGTGGYSLTFRKSEGASTDTTNGAEFGYLNFQGYANSNFQTAGRILFTQQGASSGSNVPGQMTLSLADSTSGLRTVLYINSAGDMVVELGSLYIQSDNQSLYLGAGDDSRLYYDGTDTIWNLQAVGTGKLFWQTSDTRNTGALELLQGSTGDAAFTFSLTGVQSYVFGIDNSASDAFVMSVGGTLGTSNVYSISTAGVFSLSTALAVSSGGTGASSLTAYAVLCGGTTSTGAVQSIASVGTSGQVLTSNGAGALPTFQTLSGLVTSITGTANQIIASASTGAVTLSTPQDIGTSSSVTFGQVTVDNMVLNGNTLSISNTDGNVTLTPNGTGLIQYGGGSTSGGFLGIDEPTYVSNNTEFVLIKTSNGAGVWGFKGANNNAGSLRLKTHSTQNTPVTALTLNSDQSATFAGAVSGITQLDVDNLRLDGNTLSSTNSNGDINFTPNGTGQVALSGATNAYRQLRLAGGNQYGYVFGSFPGTGDGIEMGYNFYYDASGTGQIGTTGGGTAYFQVGYGEFKWFAQSAGAGNPVQIGYMATNGDFEGIGSWSIKADNKSLYLGAGQDSRIWYDGTDTIWNLQSVGTGKLFWQISDTRTNGALELIQYSTGDAAMMFTISATQSWTFGIDNSDSDKFKVSVGGTLGTSDAIVVTTGGQVTKPSQCTGMAYVSTQIDDVTGDGTAYQVVFGTEVADVGANYNNSTGTFTAPVTGYYYFESKILFNGATSDYTTLYVNLVTTDRTVRLASNSPSTSSSPAIWQLGGSVVVPMDASDTAYIQVIASGSSKTVDVNGGSSPITTYFSWNLLC